MLVGKYSNKTHPVTIQHHTTPISGCALSFTTNNLECAVAKLYSVATRLCHCCKQQLAKQLNFLIVNMSVHAQMTVIQPQ